MLWWGEGGRGEQKGGLQPNWEGSYMQLWEFLTIIDKGEKIFGIVFKVVQKNGLEEND